MTPRAPSRRVLGFLWLPVATGLALLTCGTPPVEKAIEQRPNVLLILVDDLRPDLGAYGHPQVQSPEIDELASHGVRFERAYAQYPACNPSRVSLLTGLRPDTTGVLDNRTPFPSQLPHMVSLPQLFQDSGYFTASVGKVFHGSGRKGNRKARKAWNLEAFPRTARRPAARTDKPLPHGRVGRYSWRVASNGEKGLKDERVASRAIEVLEQVGRKEFFLAVGLTATHPHFVAPARFFDLYPLDSIAPPPWRETDMASQLADLHGLSNEDSPVVSEREKKELMSAYWACVSFVDAQVGRVLDALDRLDLSGNTIVILVSDHGYHLGEQGWWSKRTLYEASTRIPLIIRAPGMETPGRDSRQLVELVDVYPTLAELAGLEPPPGIEGLSMVPLLDDPDLDGKPAVFSQLTLGRVEGRSVRTARWRYTEWIAGERTVELFDYTAEPTETVNRADDPELGDVRRRLGGLLQ